MVAQAKTRGRIIRRASEQGWQVVEPQPTSLYIIRGRARMSLTFGRSGRLIGVIYSRPGVAGQPKKGKLAHVMGWLTEARA